MTADVYLDWPTIRHILFLSQDEVRGQLWSRDQVWSLADLEGPAAAIELGALDLSIPLGLA